MTNLIANLTKWGVLDGAKVVARFQRQHGGKDV